MHNVAYVCDIIQRKEAFCRVWGSSGAMFRGFFEQNPYLDAFRGPVGSDIQKYRVFSSFFGMDMRPDRVFSSFRGLGDEMLILIWPLFGAILETFSLPKRIQKSASIL